MNNCRRYCIGKPAATSEQKARRVRIGYTLGAETDHSYSYPHPTAVKHLAVRKPAAFSLAESSAACLRQTNTHHLLRSQCLQPQNRPQRIPASKPEHLPSCTHTQARIKQNGADRLRPSSDPPGVAEKAASRLTDAYLPTYPSIGRLSYPCNAGRSDDKNR